MSDKCDQEVFELGTSLGFRDMTKEEADQYCENQTKETGCKHDWHYIGGRVHIKALIPTKLTRALDQVAKLQRENDKLKAMVNELREYALSLAEQADGMAYTETGYKSYTYKEGAVEFMDCIAPAQSLHDFCAKCTSGERSERDVEVAERVRERCASEVASLAMLYFIDDETNASKRIRNLPIEELLKDA